MSECSATFNQDPVARNEFEAIQHMLDEMHEEHEHQPLPGEIGAVMILGYQAEA